MSDVKDRYQKVLEDVGLIMVRPGESNVIYLGATKDVIRAGSTKDRIYNEKLDQIVDSINNDSTIMLTRTPTENAAASVFKVPSRGARSTSNTSNEKAGRPNNVVVSYSDLEYDKQQIANSDDPKDRLKIRIMDTIEKQFEEKIRKAEQKGEKLEAQNLKHKKNITWSILKDEIDGKKSARIEIEDMVQHSEDITPDSVHIRTGEIVDYIFNSKDKYTDIESYQIRDNVFTSASGKYSKDIRNFLDLQKQGNKFYAYDIETIGDALGSNRFSVVEIAAQGYEKDSSGQYKQSKDRFTALIELLPEERKEMKSIIDSLKQNKYHYNELPEYQKRSIIDLMRYSSVNHSVEALKNLEHNPIIGEIYGKNERVRTEYMFANMDEIIEHMQSGLSNLEYRQGKDNIVIKAEHAQDLFNQFVEDNKEATFIGHNSAQFDDKKLKQWNSGPANNKMENRIVLPEKRIDFMNLVQSVYPDTTKLLEPLWKQNHGDDVEISYEQGQTRLYEFQKALGLDIEGKHSALADVADDGLGGVFAKTMSIIAEDIESFNTGKTMYGVNKKGQTMSWSDSTLQYGQILYADKGYTNRSKGANVADGEIDLSFLAEWDEEENRFKRITNDFNSTIINSKSFYEVQGIQELENSQKALRLYDRELNRYAFIVRDGEFALDEIQDFVQSQFYHWDKGAKKTEKRIRSKRQEDLARRRYDKMFSLDRTDMGRTGGYQSAKRYFTAAEIYQQRIDGKEANIEQQALDNVLRKNKNLSMEKTRDLKKIQKLQKKEMQKLRDSRMSHEQFEQQMKAQFMTQWNPEDNVWEFNKEEYKDFFSMKNRVLSEMELYKPAIEAIDREYGEALSEAQKEVDATQGNQEANQAARKKYAKIARKMDMAWISYTNDLSSVAENLNPVKEITKEKHQQRTFKVADGTGERTINAFDYSTARATVGMYAYGGLKSVDNKDKKAQIAKERLVQMVKEMEKSKKVSSDLTNEMLDIILTNENTNNAISGIAGIISNAPGINENQKKVLTLTNGLDTFEKEVRTGIKFDWKMEVPQMGKYDPKLKVSSDHLSLLANHHIEFSKTYLDFTKTGSETRGNRIVFNDQIEQVLNHLDSQEHLSGLKTNNRLAVEDLVYNILEKNSNNTLAFSLDKSTNNFIVSIGKGLDNTAMIRELSEGRLPTNAVNLHVPLIGSSGTHRVGERILNARTYMDYNPEEGLTEKSSTEKIVEHYNKNMKRILGQLEYSEVQYAQDTARRTLNEATRELAGIQRNATSFNDTNYFNNNMSDFIKQSQVDVQSALIKQLYSDGLGGEKLKRSDFKDPDKVFNADGTFKGLVGYDDLKLDSQYKTALSLERFIDRNGLELFVSGMKDDASAGERLSRVDVRWLGPFRDFISQTRANSIQAANAVVLEQDVVERLNSIYKDGGAYVTTNQHVTTDMQREFLGRWADIRDTNGERINEGKALSFDMKVMYMNDKDVYDRLQWMAAQEDGLEILRKEGMLALDENGEVSYKDGRVQFDPSSTARVYEQQIMMSSDVSDALKGTRSKVFHDVTATKQLASLLEKSPVELTPGMIIGHDSNGEAVFWDKNKNAKLKLENGKLISTWDEELFKLQVGGEKGTINPFSREFMTYFTGTNEVAAVMNPNVLKHKDMGMLYEAKAGIFTQKARELSGKGTEATKKLDELNEAVKEIGLEWDEDSKQYVEQVRKHFKDKDLEVKKFREIAEKFDVRDHMNLHIQDNVENEIERLMKEREEIARPIQTNTMSNEAASQAISNQNMQLENIDEQIRNLTHGKRFEVGVLNTVASSVYNYSRVVDGTGKEVIGFTPEGSPIHADTKGLRGVAWGHRELNALTQKGLGQTAEKMMNLMIEQASSELRDEDGRTWQTQYINDKQAHINRIQETHNMMEALEQMIDPSKASDAPVISILNNQLGLESLPEFRNDIHTLQRTIFDKDFIMSNMNSDYNPHGYWLELPSVELPTGEKQQIELNINGYDSKYQPKQKAKTDRIFIPFTNLEGADGQVHFRALQKNIADIYRRAEEVGQAKDLSGRREAMTALQESVDSYTNRLVYDLSSSKGLFGSSVGRVNMSNSASGLFKLIDPITSATELEGEYTFISENTAKKLGVFDQLKDGGEMFAMNNRFPTFHHDAMQVTKLKIGKNIADGEFHTTAFFSDLLKADSDGDYDNIVVDTDESIQKEWKQHYQNEQIRLEEVAKKKGYHKETVLNGKPTTADRTFNIEELSDALSSENKDFHAGRIMDRNDKSEIAAKIGKKTIGLASNLNLQLRQVAMEYMSHDKETQEAMFRLGQTIEQKLISSKHGATIAEGRAPAMELIQAIQKSGTSGAARIEAMNLADEFFSDLDMGADLSKSLEGIRLSQERSSNGLHNIGFNAGTSGGISGREGLKNVFDVLRGNVDPADVTTANSFTNMLRHIEAERGVYEGVEMPPTYNPNIKRMQETANETQDKTLRGMGKLQENTRKAKQKVTQTVKDAIEKVNAKPGLKKGLIAGGVALAGAGLYNIASRDNPIPEVNRQSQESPVYEAPSARPVKSALPPIQQGDGYEGSQAVNVSISAQGTGSIKREQVGGVVSNSLNQSGVNSSGANMHITQRDNTQNLNKIWYRDKVQENI